MMAALGNLFSWTVTAFFGAIFLLLAFETWALFTGHTPISDYIKPAVHSYPGAAFVIAVRRALLRVRTRPRARGAVHARVRCA